MIVFIQLVVVTVLVEHIATVEFHDIPSSRYACKEGKCKLVPRNKTANGYAFEVCRLVCDSHAALWPKPNADTFKKFKNVTAINLQKFTVTSMNPALTGRILHMHLVNFWDPLRGSTWYAVASRGSRQINTEVAIQYSVKSDGNLTLETNESYSLRINCKNQLITVQILASTIFGARHAMTTLTQLIAWDDIKKTPVILCGVVIDNDQPSFPYRGLTLDTSRQFYSVKSLKRMMTAMSYNKLNRFHWHMTDSNSWPIEIPSVPSMLRYGTSDNDKVYTKEEVADLVDYALLRGIAVVPEVDTPGHVGQAFSWDAPSGTPGSMLSCFYGDEGDHWEYLNHPYGLLNPLSPKLYDTLAQIYTDFNTYRYLQSDIFHMGADEVDYGCWNSSKEIVNALLGFTGSLDESSFAHIWTIFQTLNQKSIHAHTSAKYSILWDSALTNKHSDIFRRHFAKNTIVQVWSDKNLIHNLTADGYKVIVSNHDAWYLDCGWGSWVAEGPNWCDPMNDWATMYNNRLDSAIDGSWKIEDVNQKKLILGGTGAMWSESVDEHSVESKVWPRLAAIAERLWSNPEQCWLEANGRMQLHRHRLVTRGVQVKADALQPWWCVQHEGACLTPLKQWNQWQYKSTCPEYQRIINGTSSTSDNDKPEKISQFSDKPVNEVEFEH